MTELVFNTGAGMVQYKVTEGIVYLSGENTNYQYIELINPKKVNDRFLIKLRQAKGKKYAQAWKEDLEKYKGLTDEAIVQELIDDCNKNGWRLIKRDG